MSPALLLQNLLQVQLPKDWETLLALHSPIVTLCSQGKCSSLSNSCLLLPLLSACAGTTFSHSLSLQKKITPAHSQEQKGLQKIKELTLDYVLETGDNNPSMNGNGFKGIVPPKAWVQILSLLAFCFPRAVPLPHLLIPPGKEKTQVRLSAPAHLLQHPLLLM